MSSSKPVKSPVKNRPMRRSRRRSNSDCRAQKISTTVVNGGGGTPSEKLEALRNLLPVASQEIDVEIKADQLFQDTADYIVLLRTRVAILQRLIDFYGSTTTTHEKNTTKVSEC